MTRKSPPKGGLHATWLGRAAIVLLAMFSAACAPAPSRDSDRLRETTKPTYDKQTGRLSRLTFDSNKNGVIDTWTYMDGSKVLRSEIDRDEDGTIDRWEYHNAAGRLEKIGLSRATRGKVDAWAYPDNGGRIALIEISTKADGNIDRWEHYEAGAIVRADEDTTGDGKPDKWEVYTGELLASVAFDENGDGRPDRRLNYAPDGALVSIESEPDATGKFTKKVQIQD